MAAFDAHKNLAISAVATAPSPATSGTSLVVTAAQGARFPSVPFNATIWPAGTIPDPTNAEIVRVTAISTDTLTIVRAQETGAGGPAARTVIVGDQIAATVTAKVLTDLENLLPINVKSYGALGNTKRVTDAAITSGAATLTSATAAFTSTAVDAGKRVVIEGAGAAAVALVTTISTVTNATTAVVANNASTTVSAATAYYGTDDTTAINAAITAASTATGGASQVEVPPGMYMVLDVTGKNGVDINADSATWVKYGGATGTFVLDLVGVPGTGNALTANVAKGATAIPVTNGALFKAGDFVRLYDLTYKWSTVGQNQEFNRVDSVASNTVTLANRTIGSYATASTASLAQMNPVATLTVRGLRVILPKGVAGGGIYLDYCYTVIVESCWVQGANDKSSFSLGRSAFCTLRSCRATDGQSVSTSGNGYGFLIDESTHNCTVEVCQSENIRENPVANNARTCQFLGCVDTNAYDSSFNTHGNGCEDISYVGCISQSPRTAGFAVGFASQSFQDINITFQGCLVANSGAKGIIVDGSTTAGQRSKGIQVIGCTIDNPAVTPTAVAMDITRVDGCVVSGLKIRGGTQGANVDSAITVTDATQVTIMSSQFDNMSNAYAISIGASCDDITINGCRFLGSVGQLPIRTLGSPVPTDVRIEHCVGPTAPTIVASSTVREHGNVWNGVLVAYNTLLKSQTIISGGDSVATTASETNFANNYIIPANWLQIGKVLRVRAWGTYSTLGSGTVTLNLRLKMGATVLLNFGVITTAISIANRVWFIDADLTVITVGGPGSIEAKGQARVPTANTDVGASFAAIGGTSPVSVDTTVTETVQISAQHGASSASNTITMREFIVQSLD